MGRVVCDVSVSADGFVAGANQSRDNPLGEGASERLHAWMFATPDENRAEVERIVAAGAFIMGRNMFGPIRGEWDLDWTGWWGDEPPYHGPVFVLTHHAREPQPMLGGTTFTFVTDGIDSALAQARAAAGDRDVAIAGGASTINQYLAAGHLDELRVHISPITLGAGERLFDGVPAGDLRIVSARSCSLVTHITYQPA
jgi:dihydrofolate reductase